MTIHLLCHDSQHRLTWIVNTGNVFSRSRNDMRFVVSHRCVAMQIEWSSLYNIPFWCVELSMSLNQVINGDMRCDELTLFCAKSTINFWIQMPTSVARFFSADVYLFMLYAVCTMLLVMIRICESIWYASLENPSTHIQRKRKESVDGSGCHSRASKVKTITL